MLKEMGKKAGDSCKWGCVTPWFFISMGAVSFPYFPQSLCLVPSTGRLLGAELESEGRGAWVSCIVRGLEALEGEG